MDSRVGLQGVRRQNARQQDRTDHRRHDEDPPRRGRTRVDRRSRHVQCPEPGLLRQTWRRYIIGAPKAELRKFTAELAEPGGWREIREGIEVKLGHSPETGETAILCRSADRCGKEQAMHDTFSQRIEAALTRSIPPRSTARSAASCNRTSAPPRASRSPCRWPIVRPAFACTSSTTRPSTTGPPSRKA